MISLLPLTWEVFLIVRLENVLVATVQHLEDALDVGQLLIAFLDLQGVVGKRLNVLCLQEQVRPILLSQLQNTVKDDLEDGICFYNLHVSPTHCDHFEDPVEDEELLHGAGVVGDIRYTAQQLLKPLDCLVGVQLHATIVRRALLVFIISFLYDLFVVREMGVLGIGRLTCRVPQHLPRGLFRCCTET